MGPINKVDASAARIAEEAPLGIRIRKREETGMQDVNKRNKGQDYVLQDDTLPIREELRQEKQIGRSEEVPDKAQRGKEDVYKVNNPP